MKKIAVLLIALAMFSAGFALADSEITAKGSGIVLVKPDAASVSLGVSMDQKDVLSAQSKVNDVLGAVKEALKALGVKDEYISVSSISIWPNYDYDNYDDDNASRIVSWRAWHSIDVVLEDPDMAGEVIDAALKSGATELNSVNFFIKDDREAYHEALKAAVAQARMSAEVMAEAAGLELGKVEDIKETTYSDDVYNADAGARLAAAGEAGSGDYSSTTAEAGLMAVRAQVEVRFEVG